MKEAKVIWYDAYDMNGWYSKSELSHRLPSGDKGTLTETLGFIYREDKDVIVIAQSNQPKQAVTDNSLAGILVIPMAMVKDIIEKVDAPRLKVVRS